MKTEQNMLPLSLMISEIEKSLVTDKMLGKIHENKGLERQAQAVQTLINNARQYLAMGYIKRGCRAFLKAYALLRNLT